MLNEKHTQITNFDFGAFVKRAMESGDLNFQKASQDLKVTGLPDDAFKNQPDYNKLYKQYQQQNQQKTPQVPPQPKAPQLTEEQKFQQLQQQQLTRQRMEAQRENQRRQNLNAVPLDQSKRILGYPQPAQKPVQQQQKPVQQQKKPVQQQPAQKQPQRPFMSATPTTATEQRAKRQQQQEALRQQELLKQDRQMSNDNVFRQLIQDNQRQREQQLTDDANKFFQEQIVGDTQNAEELQENLQYMTPEQALQTSKEMNPLLFGEQSAPLPGTGLPSDALRNVANQYSEMQGSERLGAQKELLAQLAESDNQELSQIGKATIVGRVPETGEALINADILSKDISSFDAEFTPGKISQKFYAYSPEAQGKLKTVFLDKMSDPSKITPDYAGNVLKEIGKDLPPDAVNHKTMTNISPQDHAEYFNSLTEGKTTSSIVPFSNRVDTAGKEHLAHIKKGIQEGKVSPKWFNSFKDKVVSGKEGQGFSGYSSSWKSYLDGVNQPPSDFKAPEGENVMDAWNAQLASQTTAKENSGEFPLFDDKGNITQTAKGVVSDSVPQNEGSSLNWLYNLFSGVNSGNLGNIAQFMTNPLFGQTEGMGQYLTPTNLLGGIASYYLLNNLLGGGGLFGRSNNYYAPQNMAYRPYGQPGYYGGY